MQAIVSDPMSRKRQPELVLPLLKRHEIQVLVRAGHTNAKIAELSGVSKRTIRRIADETPVTHVDTTAEAKARGFYRRICGRQNQVRAR